MKELNKTIKNKAVECGLCNQWKTEWKEDWDNQTLADKFYQGMDFFLKHRFVSNEFIQDNFDKKFLRKNAILVNDRYSIMNPANNYAITLGNSSSTIRVNSRKMVTTYICDESNVVVMARGNAFVVVHLFDRANLKVVREDNATITVIQHSNDCSVETNGNVNIKQELNYLK